MLRALLISLLLLFHACTEIEEIQLQTQEAPIVGGDLEPGWPAVGALTLLFPDGFYTGSFCTGTLIAPDWILTAAHCLDEMDQESLSAIHLYLGPNSRGGWDNLPVEGELIPTQGVYIHPGFSSESILPLHDLGLIQLSDPLEILPIPMLSRWEASLMSPIFFVGYGVSDGSGQSEGGLKRSTTLQLLELQERSFLSQAQGTGVCFGDSGGPALLRAEGGWRLAGINSASSGDEEIPCSGGSIQIRVDSYLPWIEAQMRGGGSCEVEPLICSCPEACVGDRCHPERCGGEASCPVTLRCFEGCGRSYSCLSDCYDDASPSARQGFNALYSCLIENCSETPNDQRCLERHCTVESLRCEQGQALREACEALMMDCARLCPLSDQSCLEWCEQGEQDPELRSLLLCLQQECPGEERVMSTCGFRRCASHWERCLPSDCSLLGQACPEESACGETPWGGARCRESLGLALAEPCVDRGWEEALECGAGLSCHHDGRCRSLCELDQDCPGLERCQQSGLSSAVCGCLDQDQDGSCAGEDCEDLDPSIFPGAPERCNGLDDDCDGLLEPPCGRPGCPDRDQDGFCPEEGDCDDLNPKISPKQEERCWDGLDNNCDGELNEGCACQDRDGDGSCAPLDCDDRNEHRAPNLEEICGDGLDNDCDGELDEGCHRLMSGRACSQGSRGELPGPLLLLLIFWLLASGKRSLSFNKEFADTSPHEDLP